jgi:hypothetical protein
MIEEQIKKQFGSWTAFCLQNGHDHKNFKRKLFANIEKINKWLEPAGLQIQIVLKKQKRAGKNKTAQTDAVD